MRRDLASLLCLTSLVLSAYACSSSSEGGGDTPGDGGSPSGEDGGTGGDGSTGGDSATRDGAASDGATDASLDAKLDVDTGVDAGTPAVRFIGRFDMTPVGGPKVGYPNAQIIARFNGTEVKATFSDAMVFTDYGPSRWEVTVDGTSSVLTLNRAETTFTLATGLPAGEHTVELFRLTEGMVGTTQFKGFDFSGGGGVLLPPPPAKTRHLEFVGDSASTGYGIEGIGPACSFSSATQNARKAFPALVAKDLNADHQNLSGSGKGVYWNYDRADPLISSVIYPRILPFMAGSVWDFTSYTPDVVWVTLGGNDWDQPNANDPPPPLASFQASYDSLITTIRTKHPGAHIVCSVTPGLNDDYPIVPPYNAYTSMKTAAANVVAAKVGGGDTKVYLFDFTRSTNADKTACAYHPNAAKERSMADEAITFIKAKTGWL